MTRHGIIIEKDHPRNNFLFFETPNSIYNKHAILGIPYNVVHNFIDHRFQLITLFPGVSNRNLIFQYTYILRNVPIFVNIC